MTTNQPNWSNAEIEKLRRLFKTKMTITQIAEELKRTQQSVSSKAHKLGITKNHSSRKDLTPEQQLWLKKNYPHIATILCAMMLGISPSTCSRRAREMGIEKTAQFMKEAHAHAAKRAQESHRKNGTYPPKGFIIPGSEAYRFKPRHHN